MIEADEPLKVEIVGGRLLISIGVNCLAHAIELCPSLSQHDEKTGEFHDPVITDPLLFAREIRTVLLQEEEDGTTAVHRMLDHSAMTAIENGAEGIHLPNAKVAV
jgi:hypothetical protein